MRRICAFASALAFALLAAGCFGDDGPPAQRTFSASGGLTTAGYAYDGTGVLGRDATLSGRLNDPDNTGVVNVSFKIGESAYVVVFDKFAGTEPFKGGGIAFEFDEHGDTKNGDSLLPKMHVKAAAWGTAAVTKDGAPLVGMAGALWTAHLMLSDDTIRQADGRIQNAAGGVYDPTKPTDAKVTAADPQAIFYVKSPDGETAMRSPLNASTSLDFQGPESMQKVDIPSEKGAAALTVNVTITGVQESPVAVGRAVLTLKDAGGNATKTQEITVTPNAPGSASIALAAADITGPFSLEIVGTGAFTATVDYAVTFDDHPFIVVTWNDVTVG